jgi:diadenosine tetraphosphate (Ap4A) HIT family hydrolase
VGVNAVVTNKLAFALSDKFPVAPGHTLIIPRRHVSAFFDLSLSELQAMWALVSETRRLLDFKFHPDGFNLGVNVGQEAGQTIGHAHLHLIPRHRGDVANPTGGVRCVIPAKQK